MSKQARIILFSCLYIMGIITFFFDKIIPFSIILFAAVILCNHKKIFSVKYSIILCLIFTIGIVNSFSHIKYFDDLSSYTDNEVTLTAKVLSIPTNTQTDSTKFFAEVSQLIYENQAPEKINAKTLVTIKDDSAKFKEIKPGDTLKLTGMLKEPSEAKNPSQFDYKRYLQFKNTFSLMYVQNDWQKLNEAQNFTGKLLSKLNDTRNRIINIHAQNIKSPMLEILGGIIFGDDAVNPDNDTKTSFINSGIFHILAASGMNVTLIFGIWFFFAKSLNLNYRFSIITGILLILFYTCMTGFGPPIIRASLMLTLILLGKLIDRQAPTMALLFTVAFLMLLVNPLMIFDIGFQLSFIVTFALILTAPLIVFNFKFKPLNYILGCCMIPFIAQIFAAPMQMYYFNTFSLYSVLANIAIIPVLSIVSFAGFISSIIAIIPSVASQICYAADLLLNPLLIYIVKVANFFSELPFSIIYLKKPSIFQICLYFGIIIAFICILRFKPELKSDNKKYIKILTGLIILFIFTFIPLNNNKPEIIFFSVGNADAIMIKSPDKKYFLIDSGKLPYMTQSSQAKNIIIKYLTDKGIKNIDSFILTHFDADHAGGTIDLTEKLNISKIYISDTFEDTKLSERIFKYFDEHNIEPIIVNSEIPIYKNNFFELSVVKPAGENIINENQKSLTVNLTYYNNHALFMGDGDINSFESLPVRFQKNISILKSGHHGAKDTLNNNIINNTKLTVISTGKNIYNHPHPDTINLLTANNKPFLRTDYHNAIKIIISKDNIKSYCYSPIKRKFIFVNKY